MLIIDATNVPCTFRPWHRTTWSGPRRLLFDVAYLTREWDSCADVVFEGFARPPLFDGALLDTVQMWFSGSRPARGRVLDLVRMAIDERARGSPSLVTVVVATGDLHVARRSAELGAEVVSNLTLRRALDVAHTSVLGGERALTRMETVAKTAGNTDVRASL